MLCHVLSCNIGQCCSVLQASFVCSSSIWLYGGPWNVEHTVYYCGCGCLLSLLHIDEMQHSLTPSVDFCFLQVQDIEFTQIEMKVIEGLKIGNECLNKMHQVSVSPGSLGLFHMGHWLGHLF